MGIPILVRRHLYIETAPWSTRTFLPENVVHKWAILFSLQFVNGVRYENRLVSLVSCVIHTKSIKMVGCFVGPISKIVSWLTWDDYAIAFLYSFLCSSYLCYFVPTSLIQYVLCLWTQFQQSVTFMITISIEFHVYEHDLNIPLCLWTRFQWSFMFMNTVSMQFQGYEAVIAVATPMAESARITIRHTRDNLQVVHFSFQKNSLTETWRRISANWILITVTS